MTKKQVVLVISIFLGLTMFWTPAAQTNVYAQQETRDTFTPTPTRPAKETPTNTTSSGPPTSTPTKEITSTPTRPTGSETPTPTGPLPTSTNTPGVGVGPTESFPLGFMTATFTPFPFTVHDPGPGPYPTFNPNPQSYGYPPPTPTLGQFAVNPIADLIVTDIEITQGMQNLANQMPLAEGRWTAARVYIETDGGSVPGVKGLMIAIKGGSEYGPIQSANQPILVKEDGGDRINVDDSLLFYIPYEWTLEGVTTFKVFVYPGSIANAFNQEPNVNNNFYEVTVDFQQETARSVKLVTMHNHQWINGVQGGISDYFYAPWNASQKVLWAVFRYIPITWLNVWDTNDYLTSEDHILPFHFNDWNLQSCDASINYDAELLRLSGVKADDGATVSLYYGMLTNEQDIYIGCNPGFSGAARYGVSIGIIDYSPWGSSPWYFSGGATMVHEFFHNLGVSPHIPCNGNEASGGAVDNNYPYLNPCSIAEIDPDGYMGFDIYWGLFSPDLTGPTVISNDPAVAEPNMALPAMSYSSPKWTSAQNWCRSLDVMGVTCDPPSIGIAALPPAPHVAIPPELVGKYEFEEADEYLLATGLVDMVANTAFFNEVRRMTSPSNNAIEAAKLNGQHLDEALANNQPLDYRLVLRGADQSILYERILLDTSNTHVETPLTTLGFYELVPWVEGTAAVQVLYKDQVIHERLVSANPPAVTLIGPNGGEVFEGGPLVVLWEASDLDGDDLRLYLQYSGDNGQTWQSVLTDLNESQYNSIVLEDLQGLAGGDQSLFRITVVDGVNSASDTSDAPFSMPNQAPQVNIMSPGYYTQFATNELVRMLGSVVDMEEGSLYGDSLQWESDVDGQLGSGASIETDGLTPGVHHITLRATDSAGNVGESQVEIFIDANVVRDKPSEEEFAIGLAVLHGEIPDFSNLPDAAPSNQAKVNTLFIFLGVAAVVVMALALLIFRWARKAK